MRPLSRDLHEFIRLLNSEQVDISRSMLIQNKRSARRDKDMADIRLLDQTAPESSSE